jgi:hypothetical protein
MGRSCHALWLSCGGPYPYLAFCSTHLISEIRFFAHREPLEPARRME